MNHLYYGDNLDVLRATSPTRSSTSSTSTRRSTRTPTTTSCSSALRPRSAGADPGVRGHLALDRRRRGRLRAGAALRPTPRRRDAARDARLLGENDMMAYLAMMAIRLIELHRVLKPTGSLYLHCDPTASHYLKFLLDAVFGPRAFRNEIIWKRSSAHEARQARVWRSSATPSSSTPRSTNDWKPVCYRLAEYSARSTPTWDADGRDISRCTFEIQARPRIPYTIDGKGYYLRANGWAVGRARLGVLIDKDACHFPKKVGRRD